MRRIIVTVLILTCLAILIHDAGSGWFSTFQPMYTKEDAVRLAWRNRRWCEVQRLLEKGADGNAIDQLFFDASQNGHEDIVALLVSKGRDVNARDQGGRTALHWTYSRNVAEYLLRAGADVNARDITDRTPLHHAASCGCMPLVELLIISGADVNAREFRGKTPLDFAEEGIEMVSEIYSGSEGGAQAGQTKEVCALLRQHGGKTGKEIE